MALARKLHGHAVTSLAEIIRSRRFLEYQVLKCKTRKPPEKKEERKGYTGRGQEPVL